MDRGVEVGGTRRLSSSGSRLARRRWKRPLHALALMMPLILVPEAHAQLRPAHSGIYATADNASTVYFNPAGMTRLDERELVIDTVLAYSRSQFETSPATTVAGGDSDPNDGFIAIPSFYFATPAFHEKVRVGASFSVPSGLGADYGNSWAGRYVATESSLVYLAIDGAVAVRLTDWLSLGAAIEILYTKSVSKSNINNGPEALPDGQVELEVSGIGVGGNISALLELDEKTRLGISYRPKTETDLEGVPEFRNVGPVLRAALASNNLINKRIEVGSVSPQRVAVGIYYEPIERLSLTLDFTWIDMQQFGNVDVSVDELSTSVEGDWQDTYAVGFTAGWELTDRLEILGGFAYLSPPISDSKRTLSLPVDRIFVGGVGVEYEFLEWLDGHASFNYFDLGDSSVDTQPNTRSGRIVGKFSPNYAIGVDLGLVIRF